MTISLSMHFDPESRFSPSWDEAFVYLDEQHPSDTDPSFAVGLFMTPAPIPEAVTTEALSVLPTTNRATQRRFFHAVEDGKEAQTAFADAIRTHVPSGEFFAFRWTAANEKGRVRPAHELHMQVAALVLDHARSVVRGQINIEFASGPTISLEPFEQWLAENEDVRLQSTIRMKGTFPARFPPFSVRENRPITSSGLQVADALLWNHRRVRAGKGRKLPCKDFFERTGLVESARWNEQDGPMEKWSYAHAPPSPLSRRPHGQVPSDWGAFGGLAFGIEKAVHDCARLQSPPAHVAHLMPRIRMASDAMRGHTNVSLETQHELLKVFLMLVDTFPLYGDDSANQQLAANAATVACSMFDLRFPGSVVSLDRWADARTLVGPTALGWDVD